MQSFFDDLEAVDKRKLQYDFSDLEAIIFGVKTSIKDKHTILGIIKNNCNSFGRNNFKFYQAYYTETGNIEARELTLLSNQFEYDAKPL